MAPRWVPNGRATLWENPGGGVVRRPFLGPSLAHLGPSWTLLGLSRGVQEGILSQILGLEGWTLGCKVEER